MQIYKVSNHYLSFLILTGRGKHHGLPALFISPETLILSYSGQVKVSSVSGQGIVCFSTKFVHLLLPRPFSLFND